MRRIRYQVATSLDGYIAGPEGQFDWIVMDPEIDFAEHFRQFDTALMGSRTFEAMLKAGEGPLPGMRTFVFSRTLLQRDHPNVTIVAERTEETVARLRAEPGKDIWLFGGGVLFGSLAAAGLVDTVELAVMPVLLGAGIPVLPLGAGRVELKLTGHRVYSGSGIVFLEYALT